MGNTQDLHDQIARITGPEHVCDATPADAIDGVQPRWIVEPGSPAELAGVLQLANDNRLSVIPRGGGTKLTWGNPPRSADIVLSTRRLNRVLEHAFGDMTATVQAGCTVTEFNRHLSARGQRLAVDALWPENATIGGILATNDSGGLRARFGPLRDHLIGATVALADGTIARSGGKVVKNVAGFDLPKLFTGSFGTLGVIVEATFRLYACPKANQYVRFVVADHKNLGRVLTVLQAHSLLTSTVQIEATGEKPTTIAVAVEGLAEAIAGKVRRIVQAACDAGAVEENVPNDRVSSSDSDFVRSATRTVPPPPAEIVRSEAVNIPDSGGRTGTSTLQNGKLLSPGANLPRSADAHLDDPLMQRESLFNGADSCVSKITLPPTEWPDFLGALRAIAASGGLGWEIAGQAMGVGLLGLRTANAEHLSESLRLLREYLGKSQGSLVVLRWPSGITNRIDAWPPPGSDFPLLRRIKEQFDPTMILSPGRFIGGI